MMGAPHYYGPPDVAIARCECGHEEDDHVWHLGADYSPCTVRGCVCADYLDENDPSLEPDGPSLDPRR